MSIREPFEPPSVKDWALIIHADSAGERVDVYWVDINAGRIGLRLASEVKQWRRRDDLLTIGRRLRIAIPHDDESTDAIAQLARTVPVPDNSPARCRHGEPPPCLYCEADAHEPAEGPTSPAGASTSPEGPRITPERIESRHDYLAGRVRAILEHSETAKQALARAWPVGVSGLRNDGQSWEELDRILDAILLIEKNHSIPWYPEWNDPAIEEWKLSHPSNVWARGGKANEDDRDNIRTALMSGSPRSALIRKWIGTAISGGVDHSIDTTALAHALYEFGKLDESEWPDDDLTTMLDGSLRALGYEGGCNDLGKFNPEHAPLLMSAAFAITAGNAMLLFDAQTGKPIVRTNVRKGNTNAGN